MASLFTKIIAGDIPGHFVWEDDKHVAFLTIAPIYEGHTLVVPRAEVGNYLDMSDEDYADLMKASKIVADILAKTFSKKRVVTIIQGFEVDHVHVHLIPADTNEECPFPPSREAGSDELSKIAEKIRS